MAAGSEDVAIAEWTIELGGQSLVVAMNTITVVATSDKQLVKKGANVNGAWIEAMRLVVAGEEFDAKCTDTAAKVTTCVFDKKMTIEKEGKIQLVVDIDDDATKDAKVVFTIGGKSLLGKTTIGTTAGKVNGLTYEDSKKPVLDSDFVGSVTLYDLKVTAAKAAMENTLTTTPEFKLDTTTTNVTVFEGTYTAKKQDLTITDVNYYPQTALLDADDSVTLKLYINDKLVSSTDIDKDDPINTAVNDQTTRVSVEAGESVNVKVVADVYAAKANTVSYKVEIVWEDSDGNEAGKASDYTVDMKFVTQGSADVEALQNSTYKQKDVLLRASNIPLAAFRVNASNGNVDLDEMLLTITRTAVTEAAPTFAKTSDTALDANKTYYTQWAACTAPSTTCDGTNEYDEVTSPDVANIGTYYELKSPYVAPVSPTVTASDIKIKINGTDVDEDKISNSGTKIAVTEISENDIDEKWVEVIVSLKWNPAPTQYTVNLDKVNKDDKNIVFNKNVVPALLEIEQTNKAWSTEFKFTVKKYDSSNNVSNICFYLDETETQTAANTAKRCLMTNISNGSTLEVEGTDGVKFIQKITYTVAWSNGGEVEIKKSIYNDYFKVADTYLKIFDKDASNK